MKKLMFAAAAAFCGTVFGLESANVVGYQDIETTAVKSPMFGFTFMPVGGGDTVLLGSVKALGMNGGRDTVQVINPETLAPDAQYTYYSDEQARAEAMEEAEGDPEAFEEVYEELKELVGWWVAGALGRTPAGDVVVGAGKAFLGLSPDRNNLTFNFKSALDITPVVE